MIEGKFTVGVVVNNHFGVLNRVTGLFSKRGYNIDSLAVGETENPAYSRITLVCTGGAYMREQVVRQLEKLHDVISVALLGDDTTIFSEHLLIKINVTDGTRAEISGLVNRYGGMARDFGADFITAEVTASSERIDRFIQHARPFGILELCRSGTLAVSHGRECMLEAPGQESSLISKF